MSNFINLLRVPDDVKIKTSSSPFRFEEKGIPNPVKAKVSFETGDSLKVILEADEPVEWVRLRFNGDQGGVKSVLGDSVERCKADDVWWAAMNGFIKLPWYFYAFDGESLNSYGVKTGTNSIAYFQADPYGITVLLDVRNGEHGVELKAPLLCAEIVCREGKPGENPYTAARSFCEQMCEKPNLPKSPVYGFNNWYWAYGVIDEPTVLHEAEYLSSICDGCEGKPFMVIDDGWQIAHAENCHNGGPWNQSNECFSSMDEVAQKIKDRGCKPGIWLRTLGTVSHVPKEAVFKYSDNRAGIVLDPSHPFTLEQIEKDISRISNWGYELIKHDFSTSDLFGFNFEGISGSFYDKSLTNAQIVKNLYKQIQKSAGDSLILGCNTISHLAAGVHQIQRVGNDTSGISFEWTRRHGIHSMMRLPQTGTFYSVDPDCAAFTDRVSKQLNFDFLEATAISGCAVFASVTPGIFNSEDEKRMNDILKVSSKLKKEDYAIPVDWTYTTAPGEYEFKGQKYSYNWYSDYQGSREHLDWID